MTFSFSDLILKLKRTELQPIIGGAKEMIKKLSEQDEKIKNMTFNRSTLMSEPIKHFDIADLVVKYGGNNVNKDLYFFIK